MIRKSKVFIGTSGRVYNDWEKVFVPRTILSDKYGKFVFRL